MLRLLKFLFPLMLMADGEPNAGGPPKEGEKTPSSNSELETLRDELARSRSDYKKLEDEKKAKDDELEQIRLGKLKDQNDWQKVAQDYEKKYKEEKDGRAKLSSAMVTDKKMSSMRQEAIKAGILDSALDDLDLLDFPEVKVETTNTGRVNVIGTDSAVQRLKGIRPHWFGKAAPNVNGGAPRVNNEGGSGEKTQSELVRELVTLETEARKSGNWSKVESFHKANGSKLRA